MNLFQPNNYILVFDRVKEVEYSLTNTIIPSLSISTIEIPSPVLTYSMPADQLMYGGWSASFMVDQDMKNYLELFYWMRDMTELRRDKHPQDMTSFTSNATLTLFRDCSNDAIMHIDFYDIFPQSISEIQLSPVMTDPVICSVSFEFSYLSLRKPGEPAGR